VSILNRCADDQASAAHTLAGLIAAMAAVVLRPGIGLL